MRWFLLAAIILLASFAARLSEAVSADDKKKEPEKKDSCLWVVPPAGGAKVKLIDWRFTLGTRRFDLQNEKPKGKGPEYLEFREEKSTAYKNGIFTFIPLTSVGKIEYDRAKKTVAVTALKDGGEEVTLTGSTKTASNKTTIEAEAIIEGLGAATVKYHGGIDKGLQSVTFPTPKPAEKVKGTAAVITADDKEKTKHTAFDVQPLYLIDGQYRVLPYVHFKKTVKIDLEKIASIRFVPSQDKKVLSTEYEVVLRDGATHTLSILRTVEVEKKKSMTFVGLIGRVPVGYKLFMVDAIFEYRADADRK